MLSSNKKITNLGLQFRKTDLIKKKKKKRRNNVLQVQMEVEMNKRL